jgi:hypothetical protein
MKRTTNLLLAVAVLAAVATLAPAVKHHFTVLPVVHASGCTDATLTGNYAIIWSGFATPGNSTTGNEVPWAGAGVLKFDGAGNFSASWTNALDGKILTGLTAAGTYTVNSNCTGSLSFTTGDVTDVTANIVIVGGGVEVFAIDTTAGTTLALDLKKQ